MGSVMTDILTDADVRSAKAVQNALISKAEVAGPWLTVAGGSQ